MLYVTTRDKIDAFTAPRTLQSDRAADGGVYAPFQIPHYNDAALSQLMGQSFGEVVAQMLNLFFACGLTPWDVDTAVGKNPLKVAGIGNRISALQLWQNLEGSYGNLEKSLFNLLCRVNQYPMERTSWLKISIRISILFAAFALLHESGADLSQKPDVAVRGDDFSLPVSLWYARKMGLPIGNIICGCREDSQIRELIHLGEMKTDVDERILDEAERLIFSVLGLEESVRFAKIRENKGVFKLLPEEGKELSMGLFCGVISASRAQEMIPRVRSTNGYTLARDASVAYAALMDYRATTGSNHPSVLLEDFAPGI
ncbi:MAG: hypothetical protein IJW94_01140 [Oscillospiraceae bacterium]|nr:hypothetical protein [Oscillospiraceae bacterium]